MFFQNVISDIRQNDKAHILTAVAVGWFISLGVRFMYPTLLPHLQDSFDMGLDLAGILLSWLWMIYALGQLPAGMLSDRFGEKRVLIISTILTTVAMILLALTFNIVLLFAGTALFALATALYGPARFTIISNIFTSRDGLAIGTVQSAGSVGNSTLPVVGGLLAVYLTWRISFGFIVPLAIIATLGLWRTLPPDSTTRNNPNATLSLSTGRNIVEAISTGPILVGTVILTLAFFIIQGITGFYPTYLIAEKEITPTIATILFGMFFISAIFIEPIAGSCYDRFGLRTPLFAFLGVHLVALITLLYSSHFIAILLLTPLLSAIVGTPTILLSYITNAVPDDIQSGSIGMVRTLYFFFSATSPIVIGAMAEIGYFTEAFLALGGVVVLALLLVILLPIVSSKGGEASL